MLLGGVFVFGGCLLRLTPFFALLAACAAPPLEPVSPLPAPAVPDAGNPRDAGHSEPFRGPVRGDEPVSMPDGGAVGGHSAFGAGIVRREFCDGIDNDGDGRVDERVLNRCGECGPTPADVANAADDDCDGRVDEGLLDAPCVGDADCLDPLSCQDGRCGMGCPSGCALCDRCLATFRADDGQPLILDPGCGEACATCAGWCAAVDGVCHGGQCARDADVAACLPGFDTALRWVEWFGDGEIVGYPVAVCSPVGE